MHKQIIEEICKYFDEDANIIMSNTRKIKEHATMVRGFCIYTLRHFYKLSNTQCTTLFHYSNKRKIQSIRSKIDFLINNNDGYKKEFYKLKEEKPHIFNI